MTQLVITLKDQSYLPNIRRIVKSLVGVEKVTTAKPAAKPVAKKAAPAKKAEAKPVAKKAAPAKKAVAKPKATAKKK